MPRYTQFTTEQRAALDEIARSRPDATAGQIVMAFQDRTGRPIGRAVARRARLGCYAKPAGANRLTTGQSAALLSILAENAPYCCYAQAAVAFREMTGRVISRSGVASFARRHGFPRLGPGHKRERGHADTGLASRIAKERAAQVAAMKGRKPDRRDDYTPRTGRVHVPAGAR